MNVSRLPRVFVSLSMLITLGVGGALLTGCSKAKKICSKMRYLAKEDGKDVSDSGDMDKCIETMNKMHEDDEKTFECTSECVAEADTQKEVAKCMSKCVVGQEDDDDSPVATSKPEVAAVKGESTIDGLTASSIKASLQKQYPTNKIMKEGSLSGGGWSGTVMVKEGSYGYVFQVLLSGISSAAEGKRLEADLAAESSAAAHVGRVGNSKLLFVKCVGHMKEGSTSVGECSRYHTDRARAFTNALTY